MSQILFTNEIITHLRRLLWDSLKTSLSLKAVQIGEVSFYEAPSTLTDLVPIIFLKPTEGVDVRLRTTNFKYEITYRFRLVFVFKYAEADLVVENKLQKITTIADVLFDNTRLTGIEGLTNSQIIHCIPTKIEYDPPEDGFLAMLGGQLVSGAINIEVLTSNSQA